MEFKVCFIQIDAAQQNAWNFCTYFGLFFVFFYRTGYFFIIFFSQLKSQQFLWKKNNLQGKKEVTLNIISSFLMEIRPKFLRF